MKREENRPMDKLKSDYESIPVPAEAKGRMLAGIAQAKKEQKGVIIMRFAKETGGAAAAAMIAITVLANATPALANAMEQIPVIGSIAKVVTFRTYEDKRDNFEADIKVPQVTIEGTEGAQIPTNKSIENYDNELIAMYEEELSRNNEEGHYGLGSQYKVVTDNSKYLSIRIDTALTIASGTQFVKVFTIDKATGSIISLKDLFHDHPEMLKAVSDNIKSQMAQQMAKDDSVVYFYQSDMPGGDFKGLTGNESYYFNENGELVITFNECDVAPGYMSAVQFTIPSSITGTFWIPNPAKYPILPYIFSIPAFHTNPEVMNMIERDELPIGFTMELAMSPEAMDHFSGLTEPEQKRVVNRARNIMSHEGMRNYVEDMFTEG